MKPLFSFKIGGVGAFGSGETAEADELPFDFYAGSEAVLAVLPNTSAQTVVRIDLPGSCTEVAPTVIQGVAVDVVDLRMFLTSHPFPDDPMHRYRSNGADCGHNCAGSPSSVHDTSDWLPDEMSVLREYTWEVVPYQQSEFWVVGVPFAQDALVRQWFGYGARHRHLVVGSAC